MPSTLDSKLKSGSLYIIESCNRIADHFITINPSKKREESDVPLPVLLLVLSPNLCSLSNGCEPAPAPMVLR